MPGKRAAPPKRKKSTALSPVAEKQEAVAQRTNESILLRSGYVLACKQEHGEDVLSVTGRYGQLCLRMVLGAAGPVVEIQAASLRVATAGELRLDCERLEMNAQKDITLRSGSLNQIAEKDISVQAGGRVQSEAHAQRHRARMGSFEISANDDVALDGEQVRLNSPLPTPSATWPERDVASPVLPSPPDSVR